MEFELADGARSICVYGSGPDPAARESERVARRLSDSAFERMRRADRLTAALLATVVPGELPGASDSAPVISDHGLDDRELKWLRAVMGDYLYTEQDARLGALWLGTDPFRLRALPPPPLFLARVDQSRLQPQHVVPFLRRISLTRTVPTASQLTAAALACEPGAVSMAVRGPTDRRWGRPASSGAPLLPQTARIPRVLHGIWLGGPPPHDGDLLRNFGHAARRHAGQIDFVLWTDVPRSAFDAVRRGGDGIEGCDECRRAQRCEDPVCGLLRWAQETGVLLVNIHEVFHEQAPMVTHAQVVLEMAKQLPRGYTSASDLIRAELVWRFGGVYADGDLRYAGQDGDPGGDPPLEDLPGFFDRIAACELGFTLNLIPGVGVNCDIVAAPNRHPAIRLWLEEMRVNYFRTQAEIFGGLSEMARPYVGQHDSALRYLAPHRTGRIHHRVLNRLGLADADLPATQPPFRNWNSGSWVPPTTGEPVRGPGFGVVRHEPDYQDEGPVIPVLQRCLTFLEWQLAAREGDLYLAAVAPVVQGLPDPDAAWITLLSALSALLAMPGRAAVVPVASVTELRRRGDWAVERVELPPEARALLERRPAAARWIGAPLSADGDAVWLFDECVEPAALRAAPAAEREGRPDTQAADADLEAVAALTEVALDVLGRPVGLWIRPEAVSDGWRQVNRFDGLPRGAVGISLGVAPEWNWLERLPVCAETLAALLVRAGAAGRPVVLATPSGLSHAARGVAGRLAWLLDQPVDVVGGMLVASGGRRLQNGVAAPVTYVRLADR